MIDKFEHKADSYDSEDRRVKNVDAIANMIKESIELNKNMSIIDFGSGTGLLLERIAPYVKQITAIDKSPSMNRQLMAKIEHLPCKVEIKEIDIIDTEFDTKFEAIISSMTIHHIEDVKELLQKFYNLLTDDGVIALADLDSEDGTFHKVDTGVFHFGFNREEFKSWASDVGFKDIKIQDASIVEKPYGKYGVFLLTARK